MSCVDPPLNPISPDHHTTRVKVNSGRAWFCAKRPCRIPPATTEGLVAYSGGS